MLESLQPLFEHFDPIQYAIPFFLVTFILEYWILTHQKHETYDVKDGAASVTMGIGSIFTTLAAKSVAYLVFMYIYDNYRLFDLSPSTWWFWVLLVLGDDFSFYWHHRLSHEVRILWAAHVNHHSSQQYNLATALRQSWTEEIYKFAFWVWLPLLGFHPLMIFVQMSFSLIYQYWIHTTLIHRLPRPIEFIFNTPSHHRVHHASNVRYLDKNYAGILIIWDRLFGTFAPELDKEPVIYGITTNIHTYNPLKIASHEFIALFKDFHKARTWRDAFNYLVQPPGWSPDGSTKTAKVLQRELKELS